MLLQPPDPSKYQAGKADWRGAPKPVLCSLTAGTNSSLTPALEPVGGSQHIFAFLTTFCRQRALEKQSP